ncbi:hypothetical protein IEQ34_018706 [Dendrobium chrysotoxum]|uniref:Uncharacterized protein n=1 Tax=Dendrobium chrysotoxum TaxID=161865 RepID=A0AAV7G5B0_DENCH|nr:hypothetical protein IEQ34_018706 [Dendrobium chrysotoxum]
MVAVFNKELLSWYLITLKLKETVETNLPKNQREPTASSIPLTLYKSDPEFEPAPTPPPPPPLPPAPSLDSPWIISIREKLDQARQYEASSPWATLSIYRVPKSLRDVDETAYAPQIVSIGPYHRGRRRLRDMDRHKWRALHHALTRAGHDVGLYLDAARSLEDRARACYEAPPSISADAFVESLVLDAIFALELFRGVAGEGFPRLGYAPNDPVFAVRGIMHSLQRDMIMLENQLPLFVLDSILALQLGHEPSRSGLVAPLALRFFDPLRPTDEPFSSAASFDPLSDAGSSGALHCLDVFRRSLLLSCPKPASRPWIRRRWSHARPVADKRRLQLIHCVTELRDAGIKFRRRKSDRFWDIKFKDGILHIPRLLIHDGTKSLFLNLIAFEQCHLECSNHITSYVIFMDNLINSEVDVGYLHYRGIIEHWLGNDGEVADLFNRLCQEVVFDINDCYLSELSEQMNCYYNHRWNAWRASLSHKYFNNPWAIISLVAAVVLLLLTSAQTFYGIYAYYKPN